MCNLVQIVCLSANRKGTFEISKLDRTLVPGRSRCFSTLLSISQITTRFPFIYFLHVFFFFTLEVIVQFKSQVVSPSPENSQTICEDYIYWSARRPENSQNKRGVLPGTPKTKYSNEDRHYLFASIDPRHVLFVADRSFLVRPCLFCRLVLVVHPKGFLYFFPHEMVKTYFFYGEMGGCIHAAHAGF